MGARYRTLDEIAWYSSNSGHKTRDVGLKQANAFGLYDRLGNVWEWVADWYDEEYYGQSPATDPPGPASGQQRVLRGGSWFHDPGIVRASYRLRYEPVYRDNIIAFRSAGNCLKGLVSCGPDPLSAADPPAGPFLHQ